MKLFRLSFSLKFFFLLFLFSVLHAENPKSSFSAFTGKVLGNKVRLRSSPDLKGEEVSLLTPNDLLLIKGEIGDFYEVKAPRSLSAFVYKSLVFENRIDADRVNIRLKPDKEAPILGSLSTGAPIQIKDASSDPKWVEIAVPENCPLYVAKEFIRYAGDSLYIQKQEKRKEKAESLLEEAISIADREEKKPFEKMEPQEAISKLQRVIESFSDLKGEVQKAKLRLASLQENYLEKKLSYLSSIQKTETIEEVFFPELEEETSEEESPSPSLSFEAWKKNNPFLKEDLTRKMEAWLSSEKELFDSWLAFHPQKTVKDFYLEQKVNAEVLQGVIQAYDPGMKSRPGDFVLRKNGTFAAFLYSTKYDLEEFLGKKVTLVVSARPNHHFAFPAYFVLEVTPQGSSE